ncbi:MAG: hypothetical protein V4622_12655 [Bacteroidota bacterium]
MSKFGSKEEIIRAIESQFELMQTSKLSKDDLELLVEQTRELYERALILRHKAYEELVFGEFDSISTEILNEEIEEEELEESFVEEQEEESALADEETNLSAVNGFHTENTNSTKAHSDLFASQETAFDFDVFNETPSENVAEIVYEENEEVENEADSYNIETESINDELDEEINELSIQEFEEELETIEDKIERSEITNFEEEIEPNKQELDVFASSEFFDDDETKAEEETFVEEVKVEHTIGNNIFKEILEADDARGSLMLSGKLSTLVGSFGFNEKIQSIQELFKNSSEDFNQALDILDNLQNFEEAQNQMEYYVHLNNWNLKSEIVAEFVRKVERRFK